MRHFQGPVLFDLGHLDGFVPLHFGQASKAGLLGGEGAGFLLGLCPRDLDIAVALRFGVGAGDILLEDELVSCDVLGSHALVRFALDLVPLNALLLRNLGDGAETLGIEHVVLTAHGVRRRLVQARDGDRFQGQAVVGEILLNDDLHGLRELISLGVQLMQRPGRRHGTERGDQLLVDQVLDALGVHRALTQRGSCRQDVFPDLLDLDVELGGNIRPQVVSGDQGIVPRAVDIQAHGLQRDWHNLMDHWNHEVSAIQDWNRAAHTRPDKCLVGGGLDVQLGDNHHDCPDEEQDNAKDRQGELRLATEIQDRQGGQDDVGQDDEQQTDNDGADGCACDSTTTVGHGNLLFTYILTGCCGASSVRLLASC